MLSIRAPEALFLAHVESPTPYQMFDPDLDRYLDDTYEPGGLAGFADWVQRTSPTYIVVQTGYEPTWLTPWLQENYQNVGGPRQFDFWVSRTVGQDVRRTMKDENEAATGG